MASGYLFFFTTLLAPVRAIAACPIPPDETSEVLTVGNLENCGSTSWELKASVEGDEYDEAEYDGTGTCYGGFTYCDCAIAPQEYIDANKSFHYDADCQDGTCTINFWWNISNYLGTINYSSCGGSGNCANTGYSLAVPEATQDTNVYEDYAYEDCDD